MRRVDLSPGDLVGALDADVTAAGFVPRRLPSWTRHHIGDREFALMVTTSAGVHVEMLTDASEVELDVMLTRLHVDDVRPLPSVFDLVVDGSVNDSRSSEGGARIVYDTRTGRVTFVDGDVSTIRFVLPGDRERRVEIWLPQMSSVEIRSLRVSDGASVTMSRRIRPVWAHYGSSISQGSGADRPTGSWPAIVALADDLDLRNLSFAGHCMLDQMVARTIRDLPADLISVKVGINIVGGDAMRERVFWSALHGFLDTIRDGHRTTPLMLITPLVCPSLEAHPGPVVAGSDRRIRVVARPADLGAGALTLTRVRELAGRVVDARRQRGDDQLFLVDGLQLLGSADVARLHDDVHPDARGHRLIAERFRSIVAALSVERDA